MPLVLDMAKARVVVKSAGIGALPAARKARIRQLSAPALKKAEEKKIPIKADVSGPLAKAKEIAVKLKKAPPKKEESAEKAASDLGYAAGFCRAIMPGDEVFEKIAAKTRVPAGMLKAAYFVKTAIFGLGKAKPSVPAPQRPPISPLWLLAGGAALPWLAAPALRELRYPGGGMMGGKGRLFEHQFGGLDPRTESELMQLAMRRMAVNTQRASLARMFADANRAGYAPSISPYAMAPGM